MSTVSEQRIDKRLASVKATVNYIDDVDYARTDLNDPSRTILPLVPTEVEIRDARPISAQLDLDKQGFVLIDRDQVPNLRGVSYEDQSYLNKVADLIKELSGADMVLPYRSYENRRLSAVNAKTPPPDYDSNRPALFVHMDFGHDYFDAFVETVQQAAGLEPKSIDQFSRAAVYQAWQSLSPPPQDFPFALIDGSRMKPGNYVVMENITGPQNSDRVLTTRVGKVDPDHDWYYFPNLEPNELIIFKGNDTKFRDEQNVLHTGFDNRANEPNSVPRDSLENRFFAFWS